MSLDNIFNLFNVEEYKDSKASEESQRLVDLFKDHPLVKIGMFKKLMRNYINNKEYLISFFSSVNKELNSEEVERAGDYILYNRAWSYVKDIDITNSFHLETLQSVSSYELDCFLSDLIFYFEKSEEYEKCKVIFEIKEEVMNILEKNLDYKN